MEATNSSTRITGSATPPSSGSARTPVPLSPTPRPMPMGGDQPTVISSLPPLPAPSATDSAHRILEGRIMPGDHLGHFELLDYVGGGGMGRVFRASDTRLARIVALKVLSSEQAADAETVQRFQNEAQSAARLDHENIARVHYVGEDRGIHFIAFEFVEGVNIRVLVDQRGPLPLAEAVSYTLQVAEALAHADARSVVHRDIKPSNVIITPEGRVKLIDMGLARMRQLNSAEADLTASGVTLGTFDYISPEQARDPRNADARSDIYSLGCTFYFMLAGRPPFLEGTVLQKLLQHQSEPPPDVRQFRADLPEEVNAVLQKMLAKDPADRYADAGELAHDLLAIVDQLGLQPQMPGNRPWPAPVAVKPSFLLRHLPWMAAIAALVIIVVGLEMFWSLTAPPASTQNPPYNLEDDSIAVSPAVKKNAVPQTPVKTPGQDKLPPKKIKLEGPEKELSGSTSSKDEKNAEILPSLSGVLSSSPHLNVNPPGDGGLSTGNTAEPIFRGMNLENPQTFGGAAGLPSSNNVFPLDAVNLSPSLGRFSPTNAAGSPTNFTDLSTKAELGVLSELPKRTSVLVVSDVANGENEFTSLSAACAKAVNGDIIELCFNGRRKEKPLPLANLRLTIRAGKGYSPVLVFQPLEANPVMYPRGIFTLRSGRLSLSNLSIELIVPRDIPTENWSLFEIHGGQTVQIDRCTLTIDNAAARGAAYHPDTAFFRVLSAAEINAAIPGAQSVGSPATTLELTDSLARGEAFFLRDEELQPVQLTWKNGLLTTSETMLSAVGGTKEPKRGEKLNLNLRHLTVATRGGLLNLTSTAAAPFQLPVELNCADNIFLVASGVPFIQQAGFDTIENMQRQIVWNGDLNFYDSINNFWSIQRLGEEAIAESMNYGTWLSHWGPLRENQPTLERIDWKHLPTIDNPPHLQTVVDYALSKGENRVSGGASDGLDAGVQAVRLPAQ